MPAVRFDLGAPSHGGSWGRVRIIIFLKRSFVLGRFRPVSEGKPSFNCWFNLAQLVYVAPHFVLQNMVRARLGPCHFRGSAAKMTGTKPRAGHISLDKTRCNIWWSVSSWSLLLPATQGDAARLRFVVWTHPSWNQPESAELSHSLSFASVWKHDEIGPASLYRSVGSVPGIWGLVLPPSQAQIRAGIEDFRPDP
jgi:hypothetical protein